MTALRQVRLTADLILIVPAARWSREVVRVFLADLKSDTKSVLILNLLMRGLNYFLIRVTCVCPPSDTDPEGKTHSGGATFITNLNSNNIDKYFLVSSY